MTIDQEMKDQVQAAYHDWVDGKDRKTAISNEMKESVEVAAEVLKIDKKKIRKIFRIMEATSLTEEYDLLQLCEEIEKKTTS